MKQMNDIEHFWTLIHEIWLEKVLYDRDAMDEIWLCYEEQNLK